ncbi:hypothetical protein BDZ89DRAFT_186097 [Hymenopellis radicata]|nr:hypothetical protein BDZ89DRAFT_186097 [Hymenopellis radicata]
MCFATATRYSHLCPTGYVLRYRYSLLAPLPRIMCIAMLLLLLGAPPPDRVGALIDPATHSHLGSMGVLFLHHCYPYMAPLHDEVFGSPLSAPIPAEGSFMAMLPPPTASMFA